MSKYTTVKQLRALIREQLQQILVEQDPTPPAAPTTPAPAPAAAPGTAPESPAPTGLPEEPPMFKNDSIDLQIDRFIMKYDEEATANNTPLDVVGFADNIANLIEKVETLVDLKSSIVRRVLNHVQKTYDDNTEKRLEEILSSNFDLTPEADVDKFNDEKYPAPAADRAGMSPGGGGAAGP
jgi:hypothetical protein